MKLRLLIFLMLGFCVGSLDAMKGKKKRGGRKAHVHSTIADINKNSENDIKFATQCAEIVGEMTKLAIAANNEIARINDKIQRGSDLGPADTIEHIKYTKRIEIRAQYKKFKDAVDCILDPETKQSLLVMGLVLHGKLYGVAPAGSDQTDDE